MHDADDGVADCVPELLRIAVEYLLEPCRCESIARLSQNSYDVGKLDDCDSTSTCIPSQLD